MNNVRKKIIEQLMVKGTEEEQLVASIMDDTFDELEATLKANRDKLAPQQNEAVGFAIAGSFISFPALLKLVGKLVLKLQKVLGNKDIEENTIIKVADSIHHIYIAALEKVLMYVFRVKDKKVAHRLAVILFHVIVAGMLFASGSATLASLKKSDWGITFFEGMLSSIKTGELGAFIVTELGQVAQALGMTAELADAADLEDAIEALTDTEETEELAEISTMAGGSVQGYSLPLGKKPEDIKENKDMSKMIITKGRLRQILAEEVARHKRLQEEMGAAEEEAEAAELRAEEEPGDVVNEKKMTDPEMKEREKLVKGMKKSAGDFEKRYPGRGEEVMYATATKMAMDEEKTEEYNKEMEEKGFSAKQSKELPDALQKAMLKKEIRAMVAEILGAKKG